MRSFKCFCFNELELDGKNTFTLDLKKSHSTQFLSFSPNKLFCVEKLKVNVKTESNVKKWDNYDDIVETSKLHKRIINSRDSTLR